MKRSNILLSTTALAILLLGLVCCKKKDPPPDEPEDSVFNKQGMLVNYADNVVIPAFEDLNASLLGLHDAYHNFIDPNKVPDLQTLRNAFHDAYLKYQRAGIHGFGPGEDIGIRVNYNVFPSDTAKINANISTGSYDLGSAANVATGGFPALEYLIYGNGMSAEAVISSFQNSSARRKYGNDVISRMMNFCISATNSWKSSYRSTFVNSLGTDVGSSIGFLINQLNFELDYLKNSKIATPLGLKSGGTALPDNAEAFYSGRSVQYALETLNTIENLYRGRSLSGSNGLGFDDYISHLNSPHVNGTLAAAIDAQFVVARSRLSAIPDPLSSQVISNKTVVEEAYKELVKLLVLLKTDLPSALGVVITYQDGDGD